MAQSKQQIKRSAKRRPKRRLGWRRRKDELVEFEEILAEQDASFDAGAADSSPEPEAPTVSEPKAEPEDAATTAPEPQAPAQEASNEPKSDSKAEDAERAEAEKQAAIDAAVEERLSAISQGSESNKAAIDAVSEKLEGVMDGMSALRQLSEAISYRYNPFLDDKEGPMPGGKRPGAEVVKPGPDGTMVAQPVAPTAATESKTPESESTESESTVTPDEPPASQAPKQAPKTVPAKPAPAKSRPARPKAPTPEPADESPESESKHLPAPDKEASKPKETKSPKKDAPAEPAPAAKAKPAAPPTPSAEPVANPSFHLDSEMQRRSAIALQWFGHLCKDTDPAAVFVFLDHYRTLGWLADDDHAWLTQLAHGLARPRANATWRTFKLPADRLVLLHQRSLRVIAALIHPGPDDTEAARARRAIDRIMEAD